MSVSRFGPLLDYYEREHRNPANRLIHHLAHAMAVCGFLLIPFHPLTAVLAIIAALPLSWLGHILFERNRPAFFDRSAQGGFKQGQGRKLAVAFGGIVWTADCLWRTLSGLGRRA
jgi:hypothetical protein